MKIHQVIKNHIESILAYRDGLTELLHVYFLLDKPEHYQIKLNFISEIILCNAYLTMLHEMDKKLISGVSNSYIRSLEQFLGLDKSKRMFLAIF